MFPERTVLGLDPGIARMGFAVVICSNDRYQHVTHGCISTASGEPVATRLRALYDGLTELMGQYTITDVALEQLFYSRNVSTAVAVGQARGVALLATVKDGTALGEYTPTQVKQMVTGTGRASKQQMQQMVALILGMQQVPSPDDAADALALALCHGRHLTFSDALGRLATPAGVPAL